MAEEKKNIKEAEETVEKKQTAAVDKPAEKEEDKEGIVKFSKPYTFEGVEYNEIDLSKMADLTIGDAIDAQSELDQVAQLSAMTMTEFATILAQKATGYPIEFFRFAPASVARKIRAEVLSLIADREKVEKHILKFNKPYTFEGATYTELDLNGLADLTCMNISEAENRLTREGYGILEPTKNYLYVCIIASVATGKTEDFIKGLPIGELVKLVNEVGHEDFLE